MSDSFGSEAFTLLSLGTVVICCRLTARIRMVGVSQLDFDDYLMCFVAVVYSLETATAYLVGARYMGLANNGMADERAALDPSSHEASLRRGGSKAQVIGWCLYTFVLWLLKICMNACYSRVTYVDATNNKNKMLWRALIPLKKKIGLTVLFSAGVFVMIAGAIRCALILSNPATGPCASRSSPSSSGTCP